jgi:hypothetical protein
MATIASAAACAELVCVGPADARDVLPLIASRIRAAIRRTGLSDAGTIESDLACGRALLWLALGGTEEDVTVDAVATTRLELTDAGQVCVITACEGKNMALWLPLIRGIEHYAKAEGCRCVRIFGRKGWLRVLKDYRQTHVIIDKELD